MGGVPQRASKLNKTLEHVVDILDENNYTDWFLAYGTLLGIVRNNSCIEHDDDIDIICNINERSRLIEILEKNNFKLFTDDDLNPGPKSFKDGIVKTFGTEEYVSIDFYFGLVLFGLNSMMILVVNSNLSSVFWNLKTMMMMISTVLIVLYATFFFSHSKLGVVLEKLT